MVSLSHKLTDSVECSPALEKVRLTASYKHTCPPALHRVDSHDRADPRGREVGRDKRSAGVHTFNLWCAHDLYPGLVGLSSWVNAFLSLLLCPLLIFQVPLPVFIPVYHPLLLRLAIFPYQFHHLALPCWLTWTQFSLVSQYKYLSASLCHIINIPGQ